MFNTCKDVEHHKQSDRWHEFFHSPGLTHLGSHDKQYDILGQWQCREYSRLHHPHHEAIDPTRATLIHAYIKKTQ